MSSVLDGLGFNADSLSRNKFCMGRKYVCDGEADEEERRGARPLSCYMKLLGGFGIGVFGCLVDKGNNEYVA